MGLFDWSATVSVALITKCKRGRLRSSQSRLVHHTKIKDTTHQSVVGLRDDVR